MGIAADKVVVSDDAGPMALAPGLIGRKVTAPVRAVRIMELVGRYDISGLAEEIVLFGLESDVAEALQGRRHEGLARDGADPGPAVVLTVAEAFMEVHEAPTFGEARHVCGQGPAQGRPHWLILAQSLGVEFGIAATEIYAVARRQFPVVEGAEKGEVCSRLPQDLEAVFIIKAEGFVLGDGDNGPPRCWRGRVSTAPCQGSGLTGTGQKAVQIEALFCLESQFSHGFLEVGKFPGRDQAQMAAGKGAVRHVRETAKSLQARCGFPGRFEMFVHHGLDAVGDETCDMAVRTKCSQTLQDGG